MRIKLILPVVAAGAVAAAVAAPALADAAAGRQATPSVKTVTPAKHIAPPAPLKDGEKYPGDPYAGKCVYALVGESEVHYC